VPAAAVIPAPIAYIKVVAVKKLVVGFPGPGRVVCRKACTAGRAPNDNSFRRPLVLFTEMRVLGLGTFTLKKLECSKQAFARIH
jgi:hypothetical protein